ncbi:metallophosphoesterase family protein [Cellulomonas biazotea]|uniref:metallophosphoesterase family protein n=1 Tax=Cellulomonas biazotea TaxID=1709 RepID=UPI0013EF14D7|nr:metallophosphoesterase [Cellulomonas biazotea]
MDGTSRIAVLGDLDGQTGWAKSIISQVAARGIHTVLQVGDCGLLWPGRGDAATRDIERACVEHDVRFAFIDGNHDPHARLRAVPVASDGFARIAQHIFYIPRGARWNWEGRSFGAVGGAYSVDRDRRTEGVNLWAELEEATTEDVNRLGPATLDILLTHDAPAGVRLRGLRLSERSRLRSQAQRDLLRSVVDSTRPAFAIHGHWHQRHTQVLHHSNGSRTVVVSLDQQYTPGSWVVVNLATMNIEDPRTSAVAEPDSRSDVRTMVQTSGEGARPWPTGS